MSMQTISVIFFSLNKWFFTSLSNPPKGGDKGRERIRKFHPEKGREWGDVLGIWESILFKNLWPICFAICLFLFVWLSFGFSLLEALCIHSCPHLLLPSTKY